MYGAKDSGVRDKRNGIISTKQKGCRHSNNAGRQAAPTELGATNFRPPTRIQRATHGNSATQCFAKATQSVKVQTQKVYFKKK